MLSRAIMPKQTGLSLIELLVSITVGLIIMLGATMMVVPVSITTRESAEASKMNTDVRSILDMVTNELLRAGYGTPNAKITITQIATGSSCIVYPYREQATGSTSYWGAFRRQGNAMEARLGLPKTDDTAPPCSTITNWQPLTDSNILLIDEFSVSCLTPQQLTITLRGRTPRGHQLRTATTSISPRNTTCI